MICANCYGECKGSERWWWHISTVWAGRSLCGRVSKPSDFCTHFVGDWFALNRVKVGRHLGTSGQQIGCNFNGSADTCALRPILDLGRFRILPIAITKEFMTEWIYLHYNILVNDRIFWIRSSLLYTWDPQGMNGWLCFQPLIFVFINHLIDFLWLQW